MTEIRAVGSLTGTIRESIQFAEERGNPIAGRPVRVMISVESDVRANRG